MRAIHVSIKRSALSPSVAWWPSIASPRSDPGRCYLRFQPNVELGFGDDVTLIALNLEAAYRFRARRQSWARLFPEGKVGVSDASPDFKAMLGWTFR